MCILSSTDWRYRCKTVMAAYRDTIAHSRGKRTSYIALHVSVNHKGECVAWDLSVEPTAEVLTPSRICYSQMILFLMLFNKLSAIYEALIANVSNSEDPWIPCLHWYNIRRAAM